MILDIKYEEIRHFKKIPLNLRNFMKKPLILALMIAEGRVGVPLCFRKLVVFNPYAYGRDKTRKVS